MCSAFNIDARVLLRNVIVLAHTILSLVQYLHRYESHRRPFGEIYQDPGLA